MRAAVEATELAQSVASQRVFWWVALAFFDALAAKALPGGAGASLLCNRIDQQYRRLVEGSHRDRPATDFHRQGLGLQAGPVARLATSRAHEGPDPAHPGA